jgi:Skp family chaperone for outer membrane proteins
MTSSATWVPAAAWLLLWPAAAPAAQKIAIVKMEAVVSAFEETKELEATLEEQMAEFNKERDAMLVKEKALKAAAKEAAESTRNKALNNSEKERRIQLAQDKIRELKVHQDEIRERLRLRQKQLNDQRVRMQERIVSKLTDIIAVFAREKGYDLVLDGSCIGVQGVQTVVYNRDEIDITKEILARIKKAK